MGPAQLSQKHALPFKTKNKIKRNAFNLKQKKVRESAKRDDKLRRKREEVKEPRLKEERLARNIPVTLDRKRTWDQTNSNQDNCLGLAVDVEQLKRQKSALHSDVEREEREADSESDDDRDSMLDESDDEESTKGQCKAETIPSSNEDCKPSPRRASSSTGSTATTNTSLTAEGLAADFPSVFKPQTREPKILITTGIDGTIHKQAEILTRFFPNSDYVRRRAHHYSHKYSVKEIAKFAANRDYTAVIILMEHQKKPSGLDVVHLPDGPMFHFSISNLIECVELPGHGIPTEHYPELVLNNFRTPLGLLTAHLFRTLFPPRPELQGRQVVTLHNQRDYIFVRRHRYVFRDRRPSEKSVVGTDGKPMQGVQGIRAGLQELGPRFTLKLRRIDKGIQEASGQEWQWKAKSEKVRTRFAL